VDGSKFSRLNTSSVKLHSRTVILDHLTSAREFSLHLLEIVTHLTGPNDGSGRRNSLDPCDHDEEADVVTVFDSPGRREAAGRHAGFGP
jgi:hypothetical protein